jgi:hypothetical protein
LRTLAMLLLAVPAVSLPSLRAQAESKEAEDASDEGGEGEEESAAPDPTQPAVTAGGNYDMAHFPLSEVERTLLIPEQGIELGLLYDFDLQTKATGDSMSTSFKTHTFTLAGRYGAGPTTNIVADFLFTAAAPDGVAKDRAVAGGIEQAIVYDLLDVAGSVVIDFPDGGDTLVDVDIGLPIKYRFNNKIAILALEDILNIHAKKPDGADSTPDLIISIAGQANPITQLAIELRASLNLAAASFDKKKLPIELTVQYTLNPQFDIGLDLIAKNITPPSSASGAAKSVSAIDNLDMGLFIRARM